VKLRFRAANAARMTAVRNLSVTVKKAGGLTMKTLESILALDPADKGDSGKVSSCSVVLLLSVNIRMRYGLEKRDIDEVC
jgi:DNA repair protein RAD50